MVSELLCALAAAVSYASSHPGTSAKEESHVASTLAKSSVNVHSNPDYLPLSSSENAIGLQSEGATSAYDYEVTVDEHDCEGVLFTINLSMTYLGHTFDLEGISVQVTLHSTLDEESGEIPHDGGSGYTGTYGNFAYESDLDYPLLNWSIYAVFEIRAAGRTFEVSPVAGGSNILIGQPYTLRLTYGDYPGPGHRVSLDLNVNADYGTPDMFTKSLLACHWLRLAEKVALEEFSMPDTGVDGKPISFWYVADIDWFDITSFSHYWFGGIFDEGWKRPKTMFHEYGHFVQHVMGVYPMDIIDLFSEGPPSHNATQDHFDERSKPLALKLAWSEAWAEAFSMIVVDQCSDHLSDFSWEQENNPLPVFDDYSQFDNDEDSCEAQEKAIVAFLLDLYLGDEFGLELGLEGFWNATVLSGVKTFPQFATYMYAAYQSWRSRIGDSLSYHHIAPEIVIAYLNSRDTMTITFKKNGSSVLSPDLFDIVFLDPSGYERCRLTGIGSTRLAPNAVEDDAYNLVLTEQEMNIVRTSLGSLEACYVSVVSYQSEEPLSGPYWSAFWFVSLYQGTRRLDAGSFGLPESYCAEEEVTTMSLPDDTAVISRLRCGRIQEDWINLSPRREGHGESYFEVNFQEKTYEHLEISLSLWGEREYLNPSESVAVIEVSIERDPDEDDWVIAHDLLEGEGMQTDRYAPGTYVVDGTYRSFRVRVESRPFGTDNKGRVSISHVVIS